MVIFSHTILCIKSSKIQCHFHQRSIYIENFLFLFLFLNSQILFH